MSEDAPNLPPQFPAPPSRAVVRRGGDGAARALAVLALVATAAALWLAVDTRGNLQSIESIAGGKLAELGAQSQGARATLAQMQSQLREAQSRVAELESRLADTQEQRVTLEEMYRELSRSADDRVLADVEQALLAASQQLQLAGNVRGALAALQAADARLARAEKLASTPLRRAITQDMERLKAVPQADTAGLAVKLDGLMQQVDALPLLIAESAPTPRARLARADEETAMGRTLRAVWEDMKGLVRIRELDTPEPHLLAPAQAYFLRENLKLRLLAARVSLLARDEAVFREDVKAAHAWIGKYFDAKSRQSMAALATLKQVADTPVAIATPDINASLAAVRTARAAREKGR